MAQSSNKKVIIRGRKLVAEQKKRMIVQKTYEDAIEVVKGCAGDEHTKSHIVMLLSSRLQLKIQNL